MCGAVRCRLPPLVSVPDGDGDPVVGEPEPGEGEPDEPLGEGDGIVYTGNFFFFFVTLRRWFCRFVRYIYYGAAPDHQRCRSTSTTRRQSPAHADVERGCRLDPLRRRGRAGDGARQSGRCRRRRGFSIMFPGTTVLSRPRHSDQQQFAGAAAPCQTNTSGKGRRSCCSRSAWPTRRASLGSIRTSCRAACARG